MSGRPDFDVGDLVVCVDDGPSPYGGTLPRLTKRGEVLVVARLWPPETTKSGLWVFDETGRLPHELGRQCWRYRKIDPKPPEFWTGEIEADQRDKVQA